MTLAVFDGDVTTLILALFFWYTFVIKSHLSLSTVHVVQSVFTEVKWNKVSTVALCFLSVYYHWV